MDYPHKRLSILISSNENMDIDSIKEITADNYSVTDIQSADYLNLAQDKNILAYSKEK